MAEEKKEFLGYPSFQEFSQTLLKNIVQCTKASNEMARSHDDHEFWTSFEHYKDFCATKGTEVLNLIGEVLHHQGLQCQWSQPSARRYPHNDIEERFESLIEANDMLLERIDSQLDEIANPSKANKPIVSATAPMTVSVVSTWNKQTNRKKEKSEMWKKFNLITARNIQRPQLKWKTKVDNSNAPFVPILKIKPNAIKEWRPAQRFREMGTRMEVSSIIDEFIHKQRMGEDFDMFEDRHPYKFELDAFEPMPWQLEEGSIIPYKSLEETSLTIIDDTDQLKDLLEKLKMAKEIAIDLEHHSYRSFLGFVCLMQISTRSEDFLVDTISLREDLHILNEVFTDPNILKVLHGADKDIEWLQRDFGLYIVNMFDTGQASKVLQLARNSLAFLLKQYCEIDANKQYQLADWRLRPIPDEMVKYAREDTHYLLYIYDKLRTMLLEVANGQPNLIKAVYSMSKAICSKIYEKPIFTPDSYLDICNKYKKHLNGQQLECLKLLVAWRDRTAREEDESYGGILEKVSRALEHWHNYVIPNHMMIRIAEQLPREPEGVLACCNPIPPLVRQNVAEIYILVKQARAFDSRMLARPDESSSSYRQNAEKRAPSKTMSVETLEGGDYYPSALTGFELYPVTGPPIKKLASSISLFLEEPMTEEKTENEKKARFIMDSFRSPFELGDAAELQGKILQFGRITFPYLPRANTAVAQPEEINKRWKETSMPNVENVERPVKYNETRTDQDIKEKSPSKRKVLELSKNESTKTLRDELPKKRKKGTIVVDSSSGSESPVQFSYEKAATGPAFVPFDYSKAKIKTEPMSGKSKDKIGEHQLGEIIEEPLKKGVIRDSKKLQKSGSRSMTFKQ